MLNDSNPGALIEWRLILQLLLAGLVVTLIVLSVLAAWAPRLRSPLARAFAGRSLRTSTLLATIMVGTVPALAMAVVLAERASNLRHGQIQTRLVDTADAAAAAVTSMLDKQRAGIASAARAVSVQNNAQSVPLTQWLMLFHGIYDDFLTMLATDAKGNIVAATSLVNDRPAPIGELILENVSDRPYFTVPMRDNRPFISNVFQGRGLGSDPIVAVSAPLRDAAGRPRGVLEGSLNLRRFSQIALALPAMEDASMMILDEQSRVLYASAGTAVEILQPAAQLAGVGELLEAAPAVGGLVETASLVGALASTGNGWRVLLTMPTALMNRQSSVDYGLAALLVCAAAVLAIASAAALARRLGRTLDSLNRSIDAFTLEGDGVNFAAPVGTPAEFLPILDHMKRRSARLRQTHQRLRRSIAAGDELGRKLTRAISEKELEIEERTRDLQESNERLENLSRRDALTGIANRRRFESFEDRIRRMCQREKRPMTIIMIDIDCFKQYNDTFGHAQGDTCLRAVAETLEACAQRPLDLVARFGGEEFIAVLGATPVESGVVVAERMRRCVRELGLEHPTSTQGVVTISVGVCGGQVSDALEANAFRRAADEALYAAKKGGRDRVCIAGNDNGERPVVDLSPSQSGAVTARAGSG